MAFGVAASLSGVGLATSFLVNLEQISIAPGRLGEAHGSVRHCGQEHGISPALMERE